MKYELSETTLGEGAFGKVILAKRKADGKPVAVKRLEKKKIKDKFSITNEMKILTSVSHPNIVNMIEGFQDRLYIYFVLEVAEGGELFKYIHKYGLEEMGKLGPRFIAEVVLALEYLHTAGVLHRDIKPENMLLTDNYHVKVADFGTAIFECNTEQNRFTGTPEYVSPEVLKEGKASKSSDLWALGCVIYQLFVGRPPFEGESQYLMFQAIMGRTVEFPPYFPPQARDLVDRLLNLDPAQRLGCAAGGYAELKAHPFFAGVNWERINQEDNVTLENRNYTKEWQSYLLPNEQVIFSSRTVKRRHLSSKKRQLILTDFPRLFYVDVDSKVQQIKGQVPWTKDMWAEAVDTNRFVVHTPNRDYDFECIFDQKEHTSELWVRKINQLLKM